MVRVPAPTKLTLQRTLGHAVSSAHEGSRLAALGIQLKPVYLAAVVFSADERYGFCQYGSIIGGNAARTRGGDVS
jgi:hypothetical protein